MLTTTFQQDRKKGVERGVRTTTFENRTKTVENVEKAGVGDTAADASAGGQANEPRPSLGGGGASGEEEAQPGDEVTRVIAGGKR